MSITLETVQAHLKDAAVLCCLTRQGTVISPAELEDPVVFADLEDSGLLILDDHVLTIEEALGTTLKKDCDGLTPLTPELVEGFAVSIRNEKAAPLSVSAASSIQVKIEKMEGITLELPMAMTDVFKGKTGIGKPAEPPCEDKVIRTVKQREYAVKEVILADETSYKDGVLSVNQDLIERAAAVDPLVKEVKVTIVTPDKRHVYSNTIMDVIPVATKVEGKIGTGITNVLTGVVFVLTGMDEAGVQIHEFGSCEGYLDEKIRYGRPGCPDAEDIMVCVDVKIEKNTGMERRGPFAAHCACDHIIEDIREHIKDLSGQSCVNEKTYQDIDRKGRPRVVLVKEIMGQGAMHDNLLVPTEPAGVKGGHKNVDLGNVPVVLSANEVRDGGIHALACIGPATKEITRHFFREPLVNALADDKELNLVGVVFIGSPQVNDEKLYVSERLGALVETMGVAGAIITTEGFGNNHIDFAGNIEAIGSRGIPVVGVTYSAYQGQLVVGNRYMDAMIELNKDPGGFENEILADNTTCKEDADRAVLMLKTKMMGIPIEPANRKWTQSVIADNQALVK